MTLLAAVVELRWLLPQTRWTKYTAIVHENGVAYQEHRFVIWRQWMGHTYDYVEALVDQRKLVRDRTEEKTWYAAP